MMFVDLLLWIVALSPWPAVVVLALEVLGATLAAPDRDDDDDDRPSLALIVPAHDEEAVLARTLRELKTQLRETDRLIVVADNCSDATADIARIAGAEVLERHDDEQRGKSYALAHAVAFFGDDPPTLVAITDADSAFAPGALDRLAWTAARTGRPAQARYLLSADGAGEPAVAVGCFAFLFRNYVRQLGLHAFGLPCQLNGCGMILPRAAVEAVRWDSGHLVEDLALGLDLAAVGYEPIFCPEALVTSPLPIDAHARTTQRRRWLHGHLDLLLHTIGPAFADGLRRGRPGLVAMALDLAVPPLTLMIAWMFAAGVLAAFGALVGASVGPLRTVLAGGALLMLTLGASWRVFGREVMPPRALRGLPSYVIGQAGVLLRFLSGRQRTWERTGRTGGGDDDA